MRLSVGLFLNTLVNALTPAGGGGGPSGDAYLQEDGASYFLHEDGSSFVLIE